MKFNKDNFKQIVLYIINKISGSELGKTKLHKILVLSDLDVEIRVMNSFGLINESQMNTPSFVLLTSQ